MDTSFPLMSLQANAVQFPGADALQTHDLEEARRWGVKVFCESSLFTTTAQQRLNARLFNRNVRGMGFGRIAYGGDVIIDPGRLDSFFLFQLPLSGRELIQVGSDLIYSTPTVGSVLNADRSVLVHHYEDTDKLIVRVDRDVLERHCAQHLGHPLRQAIQFEQAMDLSTAGGMRWMSLMKWVYESLLSDTGGLESPMIAAQLEQMVVTMILSSQPNNYSGELLRDDRTVAPAFVKRIERFIEEHAAEALTMADLAEHAGVSSRSIFNGFRRYRNTSPMCYLKEVRMQRVHEELRRLSSTDTTVTAVAFRWGFSHLGHFTTDYKKRFGESPSQTLLR